MKKTPKPCRYCQKRPKKPGHPTACSWCSLARQPIGVQVEAADARLDQTPVTERRGRGLPLPAPLRAEAPEDHAWCSGCQSFIPSDYMTSSRCRACTSRAAHASAMKSKFDLSTEDYGALYHWQGGRCYICRNKPLRYRLSVDHDHQTGAVRGLLCKRCNHDGLGAFHDRLDMVVRAAQYLAFPPMERMRMGEEPLDGLRLRGQDDDDDDTPPPF